MENTNEKRPQFKTLGFENEEEFNEWLTATTSKTISFEDKGQDMQKIHISQSGEVIHCDFRPELYNGHFVDLEKLETGKPVHMLGLNGKWQEMKGLVVYQIVESNN